MRPLRQNRAILRIATYNVHKCRGLDGIMDTARIASVLKSLKADVIALQEVIGPSVKTAGQEEELAMRLQMTPLFAPARSYRGHLYGNATLSRLQVSRHINYDLSVVGCEARVCQRVDLTVEGHTVHLYNIHFGTSAAERSRQAKKLLLYLADEDLKGPKILTGDFNEWKREGATAYLRDKLKFVDLSSRTAWGKTYPGLLPIFHLDHLYYSGNVEITNIFIPRGLRALIASDHLPLMAELQITFKRG
jgi:endonuclease/exonuclease/phosphatase family metal-dependent hydrolase